MSLTDIFRCRVQDELISKSFSGRQGRAYLFHSTFNTKIGSPEDRQLLTGWHTVADVQCLICETVVGWTYLKAWEPSQKYKEGEISKSYLSKAKRDSDTCSWTARSIYHGECYAAQGQ